MTLTGRQKLLVAALVVLAAVAGWTRLLPLLTPDDELGPGAGGPDGRRGAAAVQVVELDTRRLEREAGSYSPGRDPFRYYQPPPARPPGPTPEELAAAEAARRRAEAERAAAAAAEAGRPAVPQPPEIDLTYLGSFGPKDRKIAVFTDGNDIYNALVGDVLESQFIVDQIGFTSVDIKYVDFPDLPARRLAAGG